MRENMTGTEQFGPKKEHMQNAAEIKDRRIERQNEIEVIEKFKSIT